MKKTLLILLCLCLMASTALAESVLGYRFADANEAAELRLSNRDYFENLSQDDLSYRLQKTDATLSEYETFAAAQMQDYTDEEKAAIDAAMAYIEDVCRERGYALPPTEGIVFCKSTMLDECGAGGYTHGTQIYLNGDLMRYALSNSPGAAQTFYEVMAHELFHCLTRNHPDFRAAMYGILGFTATGTDYEITPAVKARMIMNPDVEHHDAWATFTIGGQPVDCFVVFMAGKPFEQPGDSFFTDMVTALVPVDDPSTYYTSEDAENFWDVFGKNTDYVIDPEETMADNFSFAIVRGVEDVKYATPEIIRGIDEYLKGR